MLVMTGQLLYLAQMEDFFQVEYAREAVKRGTTSIGIKCSEGIVLAVDKKELLPI